MPRLPRLTFTGFLVHVQAVSSRTGAVVANLQIAAEMGAVAISGQTLVDVCGDGDTQSFQTVFMTTFFLMVAHSNHELSRPVNEVIIFSAL